MVSVAFHTRGHAGATLRRLGSRPIGVRVTHGRRRLLAPFQGDIDKQASCILVTVMGELDISTAPQLADALDSTLDASDAPVVVNLHLWDFIDSTGLSVLVRAYKRLDERGQAFSIVCPPEKLEV